MASTQRTIEAVDLDTVTDLWCDRCASWRLTAVRVALVDAQSLEVIGRYTGTVCPCGAESIHR